MDEVGLAREKKSWMKVNRQLWEEIIFRIQMTLFFTSQKIWPDVYAMDCETVLLETCAIGHAT